MRLRDYVEARKQTDADFREAHDALRPEYEYRRALIEARLARGLSQRDLAERLHTSQSVVARLEQGKRMPRIDTLHRLAEALDVEFQITPEHEVRVGIRPQPTH